MLKRQNILILGLLSLLFFCSCQIFDGNSSSDGNVSKETFDESNRPGLEYYPADDYFFVKPWNYEKEYNSTRKYPLLIYLHGRSQIKYLKISITWGWGITPGMILFKT
jgi:hypothetical protein